MNDWRTIEIYSTFLRLTGEIEIVRPDRVSDAVNRFGDYLNLRDARAEPMSARYPSLSHGEPRVTVAKSAGVLVCPIGDGADGNPALWREKVVTQASVNTQAFSLIGDVHLDPRHSLQDHLERYPGDFIPLTNVSALWIIAMTSETHTVQRSFALLNPAAILSFATR